MGRIRIYDQVLTAEQIANLDVPPPPSPVPATDQRGLDRVVDGNGIGGEQIDMGAYELQSPYVSLPPEFTSPNTASVAENATAVLTVTAADPDVPPQTVTFAIVGGADGAKFAITSGGALTFQSPPDFEAPTDAGGDNVYEVTVEASDGAGGVATQTITVTVTALNDNDPSFTSADAVDVAENSTDVVVVAATDADLPSQLVGLSIAGGADSAKFTITPGGALTFLAAPDYDVPGDANGDNVYEVTIEASDGAGSVAMQTIEVTLTPVNDNAPEITSTDTPSVAENSTAVLQVTATDADLPPQSLTVSIVGGADRTKFALSGEGGLSFIVAPDYESPTDSNGDNLYVVIVQVSDGTHTELQAILVSVTDSVESIGGDYNADGIVDAIDYTVWRNRFGQTITLPGENPAAATPGVIDQEDYTFWKANYGNQAPGPGSGAGGLAAASSSVTAGVKAAVDSKAVVAEPLPIVEVTLAEPSVPFEFTAASSPRSSRVASFDAERKTERATSREEALLAWLASRPASSRAISWGSDETQMEDGERDSKSRDDAVVFDRALCLLGE